MRRNAVGYVGLLGFLGLLGLITGNPGYYGFFGFFGFLAALWGRGSDERVDNNVNRACRNAFIFVMAASASFISYMGILRASEILPIAFSVAFAGSLILFVASFIYYNESGG
ncbi:MAG: DUF3796 domain-containing protein [Aigarchaeota archaeon]|nr:DUF3796 domain-containing protein [Aigarchaeota archaeon]MDH5703805.1 DUF3796 domain-containing protein [Aigarchaeota archaeon]